MTSLVVDERTLEDGTLTPVTLSVEGDTLVLTPAVGPACRLPIEALAAVMGRFGKPLEDAVTVPDGGLSLPSGERLVHLRFLARYDVIARDWLVLVRADGERVADLARSITAALEHLGAAYARVEARSEA